MSKKKHPKGSISDGEQRDLGDTKTRPAHDIVKTDHGKRKHTSANGGIPNLEISELINFKKRDE